MYIYKSGSIFSADALSLRVRNVQDIRVPINKPPVTEITGENSCIHFYMVYIYEI